jgi:PAS domain S-box-containing protein
MRLVYLTADPEDASLLHAELVREGLDARVEPYAAARDVLTHVGQDACDALVIDTAVPRALYLIDDLRRHLPAHPIIALTRAQGDENAGMALVAGATDCVARSGPWLPRVAALVRRRVSPAAASPARAIGSAAPPDAAPAGLELAALLAQERAARAAAEQRCQALLDAHDAERQRWVDEARDAERRWQELAAQQAHHARLAGALRAAEDRLVALLDERRRETHQVALLKEQLARQRGATDAAAAQCARLEVDVATARQDAAAAWRERAAAAEALDAERFRTGEADAAREALRVQLGDATDLLARSEKDLADALDRLGAATRERAELAAQVDALGTRLADAIGRLAAAERDREAEHGAREAAARQQDAVAEALRAERTRVGELAAELEGAHQAAQAARDAMDAAESQIALLGAELDAARAPHHALELELADARAARNEALAELARVRLALEDHIIARAALEHRATDALARAAAAEADLAAVRTSAGAVAAERDALAAREAGAQADVAQVLAELASVRATAEHRLRAAQDAEARLAAAQARAAALQQSVADIEGEHRTALEARERAVAAERAAALDAQARDAVLRDDLARTRDRLGHLTATWGEERAASERLLRAQEDRERWLLQAAGIGVATTTEHGILLRANDRCAAMLGAQSSVELLGRTPPPTLPAALALEQPGLAETRSAATPSRTVEVCVEHADGQLAWLLGTVRRSPSAPGEPPALEWVLTDVTDRHLREHQAGHSRRLDGVRELAGAAGQDLARSAHEATRAVTRLLDLLDAGTAARHLAEGLMASVTRLEAVLRQVVAYTQQRARPTQVLDLDAWLPACAAALRRVAGGTIAVEAQSTGRPLRAVVDPAELDQSLSTLGLVAREALPFGGSISLRPASRVTGVDVGGRPSRVMAQLVVSMSGFGLRHDASITALLDRVQCGGAAIDVRHEPATVTAVSLVLPLVVSSETATMIAAPLPPRARDQPARSAEELKARTSELKAEDSELKAEDSDLKADI